jgi:hypothetical protein
MHSSNPHFVTTSLRFVLICRLHWMSVEVVLVALPGIALTPNYWTTFAPPQWSTFTPPLTLFRLRVELWQVGKQAERVIHVEPVFPTTL